MLEERGNDKANMTLQFAIAGVVVVLLVGILCAIVWAQIPQRNDAAFNILLGNVMGWMGALVAFGFPSNIGNAKKDETIKNLSAANSAPITETTTRTVSGEAKDVTEQRGAEGRSNGGVSEDKGTGGGPADFTSGEPAPTLIFPDRTGGEADHASDKPAPAGEVLLLREDAATPRA